MKYSPNNVLLKDHNAVFMLTARSANSSIKVALLIALRYDRKTFGEWVDSGGGRMGDSIHGLLPTISAKQIHEEYLHFWKVATIRNPWDRMVSCWMNKTVVKLHPRFKEWGCWFEMPFRDFVKVICLNVPDSEADIHVVSQHVPFMYEGKFIPDYIVRYENLNVEWEYVKEKMKDILILPDLEMDWGKTQHPCYQGLYYPHTRELVRQRYQTDINMFNYEY